MQPLLRKKLIGTAVYGIALTLFIAGVAMNAHAKYVSSAGSVIVDGQVAGVSATNITLITPGTSALVIAIDGNTHFSSGLSSIADISVGDTLSVTARNSIPSPVARLVKLRPNTGYGAPGTNVLVHEAPIAAIGPSTIAIFSDGATITFLITPSTKFIQTSFASLVPGNRVQIIGADTGSAYVAEKVILR